MGTVVVGADTTSSRAETKVADRATVWANVDSAVAMEETILAVVILEAAAMVEDTATVTTMVTAGEADMVITLVVVVAMVIEEVMNTTGEAMRTEEVMRTTGAVMQLQCEVGVLVKGGHSGWEIEQTR